MPFRKHLLYLIALASLALSLPAVPCNTVPSVSPQAVSIELGKFQIVDVLAGASDPDGQALTVALAGDTCPAQVSAFVDSSQALAISASALSSDCQVRFRVSDGAGGTSTSHVSVSVFDPNHIFSDGFELGNTRAWSRSISP